MIREITNDHTRREQIDNMELSIDVYDPTEFDQNSDQKVRFLWFRLLIDILIKIEDTYTNQDILTEYRKENPEKQHCDNFIIDEEYVKNYAIQLPVKHFVSICQHHFAGNEQRLAKIAEFEATYQPSRSIYWYTRETFVYRLLNKALRYQNIDHLYQCRFLMRDIFNQLSARKDFDQSHFHLYRGQAMFNEEFYRLTRSSNQLLRINSFFSTTKDKQIAVGFAISSVEETDSRKRAILFDIEINTQIGQTRPYADISDISQHHEEAEVLFMCGTVFRLKNVTFDQQMNIWIIELQLCSEDDYEYKMIYKQFQQQYLSEQRNLNLIDLGNILKDIGDDGKAEKYYSQLLNTLNEDDPHIQRCYHNFGILAYRKSDFETALKYFRQALDMELRWEKCEPSFIRNIYTWIGNVYFTQSNLQSAFENYNKALNYQSELDCRDRMIETALYANIASVYTLWEQHELALEKHLECLNLKLSFLDAKDPNIAASKVNIGIVYRRMKDYRKAIDSLQEALDIQREALPGKHPDIATTLYNIGMVYEERHDYHRAFDYYTQAADKWPPAHPYRSKTAQALRRVELKLDEQPL